MKNLSRVQLRKKFSDSVKKHYKIEEYTGNPFNICALYGGDKICIFLKNVSPAYFKNSPDISRIQVARIPAFEKIKDGGDICVPIGYDSNNDSFVVWNPWLFILRINEKKNISIYSRFSEQKGVKNLNATSFKLTNGEVVFCVNSKYIGTFLLDLEKYFIKNVSIEKKSSGLDVLISDVKVKNSIRSFLKEKQILFAVQVLLDYYEKIHKKIQLKEAVQFISNEYKLLNY